MGVAEPEQFGCTSRSGPDRRRQTDDQHDGGYWLASVRRRHVRQRDFGLIEQQQRIEPSVVREDVQQSVDTAAPILTSTGAATTRAGQGTAAAAWAANCRMTLPKTLGRALGVAGAGSGLTSRALGITAGAETAALSTANQPPYTPTGTIANGAIIANNVTFASNVNGGQNAISSSSTGTAGGTFTSVLNLTQGTSNFSGTAQGGSSAPFSIMQPSAFLNAMIKQ
jgi:hypothetical protein